MTIWVLICHIMFAGHDIQVYEAAFSTQVACHQVESIAQPKDPGMRLECLQVTPE
jgi:hypothetical protein